MIYRLMTQQDDTDIPYLLSIYKLPNISCYISIDEENYWPYVTMTENVYYYKVYKNSCLVATIHCELQNRILFMSIMVIPEHQKEGIGTKILNDIQHGQLQLDFDKIEVSIDETNVASIKLFEKMGFGYVSKDGELLEYVYLKRKK